MDSLNPFYLIQEFVALITKYVSRKTGWKPVVLLVPSGTVKIL